MTTATLPKTRSKDRRIGAPPPQKATLRPNTTPPRVRPKWNILERQEDANKIAQLERKVSELEMSITKAKQAERQMTIYGPENSLEDATTMVAASPKFADLTPVEHVYVAQVALATGINPEFGIHAFATTTRAKDARGNWGDVRQMRVMPDYKALINLSNRRYLMTKDRRLTPDEMLKRGIPKQDVEDGAIAYMIEGYELDKAALAKQAGIEYEPMRGFGWWPAMKNKDEWSGPKGSRKKKTTRAPNDVPNGRDGEWVAWKRATRDLYNQLADMTLKFSGVQGATVQDDEYIFEGEVVGVTEKETETHD
jgi:hypothetical protein